jgi:zinc-ribbon domain
MADFCTKCGTPLGGDTAFCTKCGAPVGAAPSAAQPAPPAFTPPAQPAFTPPAPQAYTPPVYTQPASNAPPAFTPPASSAAASPGFTPVYAPTAAPPPATSGGGGSALKIILIIVAVFVGLGILSVAGIMFGIYRISRHVHVGNNGSVEVSTPGGTFSAGNASVSASDLGVDLYPGASQQKGAVRISTPNGTAITAVYQTSDSLDKVVDFYKEKMGPSASVFQSDKSAVMTLNSDDKKTSVMVTISTEDNDGQTKIAILHSKST